VQIGVRIDPTKIGDLTDNRILDIKEMGLVQLSPLSSVDTFPLFQHYSSSSFTSTPSSSTMSDIYTHDPVMDFTNPFLDFNQGYVLSRFSPIHSFSSKFKAPKHSFKS